MSDSYRDLLVWQKAMALATDVYAALEAFPARERYGLVNQLGRAVVAVPSDIAEGKGRISKKEFLQLLARARGSLFEVLTQLELSRNLKFLPEDTFEDLFAKGSEVGRLLSALMNNLRQQIEEDERK